METSWLADCSSLWCFSPMVNVQFLPLCWKVDGTGGVGSHHRFSSERIESSRFAWLWLASCVPGKASGNVEPQQKQFQSMLLFPIYDNWNMFRTLSFSGWACNPATVYIFLLRSVHVFSCLLCSFMPPPQGRKSSHLTGHCWAPAAAATQDLWCLARGLHQVAYLNEVFASHSTNTNKVPLKIHFISDHLSFEKSEKKGNISHRAHCVPQLSGANFKGPLVPNHWWFSKVQQNFPSSGSSQHCRGKFARPHSGAHR